MPKQFLKLAGLPILIHTLKPFEFCDKIDEIIIVSLEEYIQHTWEIVIQNNITKIKKIIVGGKTRQESSKIGIDCCGENTGYVLIHDAVRPFVSENIIIELIKAVKKHKSVDTVIPTSDTMVEIDQDGFITNIPDRKLIRRGQTPQAFEYDLIKNAHLKAIKDTITNSTDDCYLTLRLGYKVFTVMGDEQNIKITYPIDHHIADKLFQLKNISNDFTPSKKQLNQLKDKVFIIIGGTSGIGLAIKTELENNSAKVYSLSRHTKPKIDIRNFSSVKSTLERIWKKEKRIDCIINSAGILLRNNVEFMNTEDWKEVYDTNVSGCFNISKTSIPFFKKQGGGSLIFIASSSYTRGREGYAAYSSSKAALVNFCQALSEEVSSQNISVNVISPTRVNTPLRFKNFGREDPRSLLSPEIVAEKIYEIIFGNVTGSVFDVS